MLEQQDRRTERERSPEPHAHAGDGVEVTHAPACLDLGETDFICQGRRLRAHFFRRRLNVE